MLSLMLCAIVLLAVHLGVSGIGDDGHRVHEARTRGLLESGNATAGPPGTATTRHFAKCRSHTPRIAGAAVVRLGLLLPMSGWAAGLLTVGAATLAIADINANPTLLPGVRLEFKWRDDGCR